MGHSGGSAAGLAYVQALETGNGIGGMLLVAACCKPLSAVRKSWDFFPKHGNVFDWEMIKTNCGKVAALRSDNDKLVPREHADELREKLGAEIIVCEGMGHFHTDDGAARLPVARDVLLEWTGIRTRQSWPLIPPGFSP